MSNPPDEFDAARTVVETLKPFEQTKQKLIFRWASESLGIFESLPPSAILPPDSLESAPKAAPEAPRAPKSDVSANIKSFVESKNPKNDVQFAATIAYFHQFVAPTDTRKDEISGEDLLDACRKVGRTRFTNPTQTLINAHALGLLDKGSTRGYYRINAVGENLVAMTLPETPPAATSSTSKKKPGRKSRQEIPKKRATPKTKTKAKPPTQKK
jgi:hypothetical protein